MSADKLRQSHTLRDMKLVGPEKVLAAVVGHAILRADSVTQDVIFNKLVETFRQESVRSEILDAIKKAGF